MREQAGEGRQRRGRRGVHVAHRRPVTTDDVGMDLGGEPATGRPHRRGIGDARIEAEPGEGVLARAPHRPVTTVSSVS